MGGRVLSVDLATVLTGAARPTAQARGCDPVRIDDEEGSRSVPGGGDVPVPLNRHGST